MQWINHFLQTTNVWIWIIFQSVGMQLALTVSAIHFLLQNTCLTRNDTWVTFWGGKKKKRYLTCWEWVYGCSESQNSKAYCWNIEITMHNTASVHTAVRYSNPPLFPRSALSSSHCVKWVSVCSIVRCSPCILVTGKVQAEQVLNTPQ